MNKPVRTSNIWEDTVRMVIPWEEMLSQNKDNNVIDLIEPGDVVTIEQEEYTIISADNNPNLIWVRPHTGYLGDRIFPIEKICASLTDEFIVERRLEKLNLEDS